MALLDKAIYAIINGKKTITEPTFIKDFDRENQQLKDLLDLSKKVNSEKRELINRDITFLKQGLDGEQNVSFELKNSFIPMLILHDIRLQYIDYIAQMDFIVITHKFMYVLETKKLNGDIEITRDGDFIRYFKNSAGKVIKKEGIYSPISQNTRHVTILKEMLTKNGLIRIFPIKSAVIIANPKTILNKTKCPKPIQNQLFKYDQLTNLLKKELAKLKEEIPFREKQMFEIADFLVTNHKPILFDNIARYSLSEGDFANNTKTTTPPLTPVEKAPAATPIQSLEETLPEKSIRIETQSNIEESNVYKALKEYRLITSRVENIKPYFIYNNDELECLIRSNPKTKQDLLKCKGFKEVKVEKYGDKILSILKEHM